jgi:hypothetical protein
MTKCQYIGPEQTDAPFTMCGKAVFPGKSYCPDHVWKVYQKGSSTGNKRKIKEIERELEHIKQLEEIGNIDD